MIRLCLIVVNGCVRPCAGNRDAASVILRGRLRAAGPSTATAMHRSPKDRRASFNRFRSRTVAGTGDRWAWKVMVNRSCIREPECHLGIIDNRQNLRNQGGNGGSVDVDAVDSTKTRIGLPPVGVGGMFCHSP